MRIYFLLYLLSAVPIQAQMPNFLKKPVQTLWSGKQKLIELWRCMPPRPDSNCSHEAIVRSRNILIGTSATVLAAALIGAGFTISQGGFLRDGLQEAPMPLESIEITLLEEKIKIIEKEIGITQAKMEFMRSAEAKALYEPLVIKNVLGSDMEQLNFLKNELENILGEKNRLIQKMYSQSE